MKTNKTLIAIIVVALIVLIWLPYPQWIKELLTLLFKFAFTFTLLFAAGNYVRKGKQKTDEEDIKDNDIFS